MAEALVSGILTELINFISDKTQQEFGLLTGVENEVKTLENNLKAIQVVLKDAEEKQMKSQSIQLWLERLKDAAYDMEDELDEWNTRLLRFSHNASFLRKKVLSLVPCFPFGQAVSRRRIGVRIKEINEKLDEIAKQKDRYQLTAVETRQARPMETVSFVDVSTLFGRDKDKENLIESLLSETSEASDAIQTISVVGMGGIGKTALAQLVYNDHNYIQAHFDERIWVYVSNDFDQTKVARDIIVSLEKQDTYPMYLLDSVPLQSCLETIQRRIQVKKFLLVLDDVWTEHDEDWEPIRAALQYECWEIIREVALFHGRDGKEFENLEKIGREIAKKCKGLPLVAKTLGGVLQGKRSKKEWENVLLNESWELNLAQENHVFNALLLSYHDLPFPLKPCILYCALLEKYFIISKDQLIEQWSCLGLEKLPDGIVKLMNLRVLNTMGSRRLTYYPKGIGRLTRLTEVARIIVRADRNDPKEFSLRDFESLNNLQTLLMHLVGNVIDEGEAERAKFQDKKHLVGTEEELEERKRKIRGVIWTKRAAASGEDKKIC
ncbi:Disease resistance protein [Corchorus olitorius]|uniref:Disease resistance protein n=1 Tax=Corchorus olitorius TaxID=93759 RepID=A0A1R3JLP2_9ROSI|nr:Disease resistance protein [Corchorus olitorius]